MESIKFIGIPQSHTQIMTEVFDLIAEGKRKGVIDELALERLLGDLYSTKFITTKSESDFWLEKWRANPKVDIPWDFGSWVDAFINAEIDLHELKLSSGGSGEIVIEQLSCPSGGIDAAEQIIKIFGGKIVSNSAI